MKVLAVVLAFTALVQADVDLDGSKVFNIWPETHGQRAIVGRLEYTVPGLDMWQKPRVLGREARVLVPASQLNTFEEIMHENFIPYKTFMADPRRVLQKEIDVNIVARSRMGNKNLTFDAYMSYAEINAYLDDLAVRFPEKVRVETVERTENNREIKVIRISQGGGNNVTKPVFIFDAGIHAREWIAPTVALHMIYKLVENITQKDVAEQIDWVIFPLLNPDGYEYSRTDVASRLWRKTRSTKTSTTCPGVDANRNFDFHWMESGASQDPCNGTYAGPSGGSEPESRALTNELLRYQNRTKAYVAAHSHGGFFIYPFAYDGSLPPNAQEVHSVGLLVARSIDDHKEPTAPAYLVGNAAGECCPVCCPSAGGSDDYAMGVAGVSLAYTLELPSGGAAGFDPPPTRIRQTIKETWAGMVTLARYFLYLT